MHEAKDRATSTRAMPKPRSSQKSNTESMHSNCHILQFLHQMFKVSALLIDDALLKCVITEVVLFSIVAFETLTFHKVV